jgi:hypothetical protein
MSPLFGPPDVEKMKAKRDVKGLIKTLNYKSDPQVRRDAARLMGEIKDPRAIEPLIAALHDEKIWWSAAMALGEIGDSHAVAPLISALRFDGVRDVTAERLRDMSWQPDNDHIGAVYWIAQQNWDGCVRIGAPAVEPLIAELNNKALCRTRIKIHAR